MEIVLFLLHGEVEQWYTIAIGRLNEDWEELIDKFCLPVVLYQLPTRAILDLKQNEKGVHRCSLGQFFNINLNTGPNMSLPDSVLLHFSCSGLDIEATLCLDITARYLFSPHKLWWGMSSFEEPSSVESLPILPIDLTVEPSPEPEIPKGGAIQPSEFLIKLEEYGRTLNLSRHEEDILLPKEISLT